MYFFKSYFSYTKSQKIGVVFLIFLILLTQIIYLVVPFSSEKTSAENKAIIATFQKEYDSLQKLKETKKTFQTIRFNPNYLSDFRASTLGMSVKEIDRLNNYRAKGKFVNSAKEFQKITKISDSLLLRMQGYFKFPAWVQNKKKRYVKKKFEKSKITTTDLNQATAKDFQTIHLINYKLANRIVAYRNKLQGFTFPSQLTEVYYLTKEQAKAILQTFSIKEKPIIKKVNVNTATFKEILHLPYIDYELTKKILNYRDEVAEIQDILELKKIDDFPLEKFNLITLYLEAK